MDTTENVQVPEVKSDAGIPPSHPAQSVALPPPSESAPQGLAAQPTAADVSQADISPAPATVEATPPIPQAQQPVVAADPPAQFQDAQPTPNDVSFDPIPPALPSGGMAASDSTHTLVGIPVHTSTSIGPIKRSEPDHPSEGEDTARFAKRLREDGTGVQEEDIVMEENGGEATPVVAQAEAVNGAAQDTVPPAAPIEQEIPGKARFIPAPPPADPNAPPQPPIYIVGSYQPASKPRFGPTSPLTTVQHKSLISYIRSMKKTKEAFPFLQPVDPIMANIPHYPTYITKPSDISTIEAKLVASDPDPKKRARMSQADLVKGSYACVADVVDDVRQMFINTRIFNGPVHWVTLWADKLEEGFDKYLEKAPLAEAAPAQAPTPPAPKAPSPAIEQRVRRPSFSVPTIRRNSDDLLGGSGGGGEGSGGSRPKREIHPPAPKDQAYEAESSNRKGGPEAQLEWARRAVEDVKRLPYVVDFLQPVDHVAWGLTGYTDIVKHPMDLSTIVKKLNKHVYQDASGVDSDVRLMCTNAMMYNKPGDPVYLSAEDIEKVWSSKWANRPWGSKAGSGSNNLGTSGNLEEDAELREIDRQIAELQSRREEVLRRGTAARDNKERAKAAAAAANGSKLGRQSNGSNKPGRPAGSGKPKNSSSSSGKPRKTSVGAGANGRSTNPNGQPRKSSSARYHEDEDASGDDNAAVTTLSQQQKQDLADKIGNAPPDILQQAIVIIQESTRVGDNGEEIELDIDALPAQTVVRLYNLVVQGLAGGKAKTKRRPKPKHGGGGGGGGSGAVNGGGSGKKKGSEQERIQKMEQQLAAPDGDDDGGDSDASSVAYSEEEYSAEEA